MGVTRKGCHQKGVSPECHQKRAVTLDYYYLLVQVLAVYTVVVALRVTCHHLIKLSKYHH